MEIEIEIKIETELELEIEKEIKVETEKEIEIEIEIDIEVDIEIGTRSQLGRGSDTAGLPRPRSAEEGLRRDLRRDPAAGLGEVELHRLAARLPHVLGHDGQDRPSDIM